MSFDIVIQGGTVIDGTGAARCRADVGIRGDRIEAISDLSAAEAAVKVPAAGKIVAPGFIDIHTHSDLSLFRYPEAESRIRQGITTEVAGNCSYSPFPVNDETRAFMAARLEGTAGDTSGWTQLDGYARRLEERGIAVNVAPLVGHGAIRGSVMGFDDRPPTAIELRRMEDLARESIDQGAFGFTTGLTLMPSSYAETDEIVALARVAASRGAFYATHSRLWSGYHFKAAEEAIEIGRRAGIAVQISHQTIVDSRYYGQADRVVGLMEQARAEGIDVRYDVYPYTAGGTPLDQLLPDWSMEGGIDALLARLRDPMERARVRDAARPGWFRGIPWQWDRIFITRIGGPHSDLVGRSLAEAAETLALEPLEGMLTLIERSGDDVAVVVFNRDEDDVRYFLRHPLSMIGSDGRSIAPRGDALATRPHPRFYGTFPRVLGRYWRERGDMSLEQAVHKMTAAPAARLGLRDRGRLAAGCAADVVVFDPATVADRATFEDPHQFPVGIDHVLVNGRAVCTAAGTTAERPGRVLRKA
jgi:N-acyl-D-aspartate/D-glutamate deacylase